MDKQFFLDIFNNILNYNDRNILIIFDVCGNIWFKFRDLLKILNYSNYKKCLSMFPITSKFKSKLKLINQGTPTGVPLNDHPDTLFINESGLYELLSKSHKPKAKIFIHKYFSEIMPEIRKTGIYKVNNENQLKINKLNDKLKEIKEDNIKLIDNLRNLKYPISPAIYIIIQKYKNKYYYKVGYTKNLNNRLKVYNTSFSYKIKFNYYILIDDYNIDKCIKNIMRNEQFIKNKEYYKSSLDKTLKFIQKCNNKINIINCGYCLKKLNFKNISNHKCIYIK